VCVWVTVSVGASFCVCVWFVCVLCVCGCVCFGVCVVCFSGVVVGNVWRACCVCVCVYLVFVWFVCFVCVCVYLVFVCVCTIQIPDSHCHSTEVYRTHKTYIATSNSYLVRKIIFFNSR